jgi:putative chitinase
VSTITAADWLRVLLHVDVKPATAAAWADPFAAEWQPSYFSAGMDDIIALLPHVLHETTGSGKGGYGPLERLEENLSYNAERICEVWPSRFPTLASATPYAHSPQKLANFVYGGRMGNCDPGDGFRFRGMGPPMLTGRAAYRRAGELAGQDLETMPELILQPHFGLEITRRWWEGEIPDEYLSDQVRLRRRYNGALLGLEHVQQLQAKLREALA